MQTSLCDPTKAVGAVRKHPCPGGGSTPVHAVLRCCAHICVAVRCRLLGAVSCRWSCTCECRQGLGCEACRTKYGRQSTAALPSWAQQCWAPSRARCCSVGALRCHQKLQTRCGASAKQRKQNGAAGTVGRQIFSLPAALRSDAVLYEPMLRVAAVCRAK